MIYFVITIFFKTSNGAEWSKLIWNVDSSNNRKADSIIYPNFNFPSNPSKLVYLYKVSSFSHFISTCSVPIVILLILNSPALRLYSFVHVCHLYFNLVFFSILLLTLHQIFMF